MPAPAPFLRHLAAVPDPRVKRTRRHALIDILAIALTAVLSGAEGFVEMEAFAQARADWLREVLGLELAGGVPSHDTFGRVFARLDPEALSGCLLAWTRQMHEKTQGEVVALDGKTLRHSLDTATGAAALHLVRAWATTNGLTLGQKRVDAKSNEITAVPALLRLLDLEGCVVTLDAMGCQKEVAKQIIAGRADYVLSLKQNQERLHAQVADFFAWAERGGFADFFAWAERGGFADFFAWAERGGFADVECSAHETRSWGHGRREVRQCFCLDASQDFPEAQQAWPGLRTLAMVRATRQVKGKAPTTQRRFFLSSLPPGQPRRLLRAVRRHWHIENRLHWVLDMAFSEDACSVRKGHAPENLAAVRQIALDLLRQEASDRTGVKVRRRRAGWDREYLLKVLAGPAKAGQTQAQQ